MVTGCSLLLNRFKTGFMQIMVVYIKIWTQRSQQATNLVITLQMVKIGFRKAPKIITQDAKYHDVGVPVNFPTICRFAFI